MFKTILIATDGSKHAEHAAKIGIKLAGLCRAKVFALYVADTGKFLAAAGPTFPYPDVSPATVNETYTTFRDFLLIDGDAATKSIGEMADESQVSCHKAVIEGYPASVILEKAEKESADLIVIGSIGRTGLQDTLLGGVAGKVIHTSRIPVLVVPGKVGE